VWTANSSSDRRRTEWRRDVLSGGATAATPARQPGGYGEPSSMRSSSMGWHGMANSPRGILGGGGDQSSACDGVPFFLKHDDGEGVLQRSSSSSKTSSSFPLVSSSSSWASIAASGGGIRCATTTARAKAAAQFRSKIRTI
jgi:hypothetical protein